MLRTHMIIAVFFLAACAGGKTEEESEAREPNEARENVFSSSESSVNSFASSASFSEQIPAELSMDYFSRMTLVGSDFTLGPVLADTNAYVRHYITYDSNGLNISGILNIPKGDGPFPLVVLNHGYIDPDVYTNGRGLKREQDALARQGYAVLHSDYRGHADSDESPDTERRAYDAGLEYSMDVVNAIHAIRAAKIPRIDATRIGILGHSMGGGITLNIAVAYPKLIDAIVLYAPVSSDAWENYWRWRRERGSDDRTAEELGTRETDPKKWDALSSMTMLRTIDDPVLLFHGTNDKDVPYAWSENLVTLLQKQARQVELVTYEGEGHEFAGQFPDFMEKTAEFFRKL